MANIIDGVKLEWNKLVKIRDMFQYWKTQTILHGDNLGAKQASYMMSFILASGLPSLNDDEYEFAITFEARLDPPFMAVAVNDVGDDEVISETDNIPDLVNRIFNYMEAINDHSHYE